MRLRSANVTMPRPEGPPRASAERLMAEAGPEATVHQRSYYDQYHGHPSKDLRTIVRSLRAQGKTLIWLAGDSSLDNKYWFSESHPAVNGYEKILQPAQMKADVNYWFNVAAARIAAEGGPSAPQLACINTAIEATSLNDRACGRLLSQDRLIRELIGPDDYLIVSVGGNDVALQPLLCTIGSMFGLVYTPLPTCAISNFACACPPNLSPACDFGCAGCGVSNCLSSVACGFPLGFPCACSSRCVFFPKSQKLCADMVDMFKNRVGHYVRRLVSDTKPKKVVICMIYHLDEKSTGSWADCALKCLCYDCCPGRLQAGIEATYRQATSKIRISGTEVQPFALFDVLDGKTTSDYLQRVEPSPQGGRKMADALLDAMITIDRGGGGAAAPRGETVALTPASMER